MVENDRREVGRRRGRGGMSKFKRQQINHHLAALGCHDNDFCVFVNVSHLAPITRDQYDLQIRLSKEC